MKLYINSLWIISVLLIVLSSCQKDPFEGNDNYITAFTFQVDDKVYPGIINDNEITITVPSNVDLNKATVKYTLSELAQISPKPESVKDWNTKQQFTVKSYNGKEMLYSIEVVKDDVSHKGDIILITNQDVEEFAARGITVIDGNLFLGAETGPDSITNIDALQKLKEVKYTLRIGRTFKCENLNGLKNLTKVGTLMADLAPNYKHKYNYLQTIDLPSLEKVFTDVSLIMGNSSLHTVSFPKLQSVGTLTIEAGIRERLCLDALQTVNSLNIKLRKSTEDENSEEPIGIEELNFPNLTRCTEGIDFVGFSPTGKLTLPKVIAFPKLEVTQDLKIANMFEMEHLKANKLKSISGKLYISSCPQLGDFSQISNMEDAGSIELYNLKVKDIMPLLSKLKTLKSLIIRDHEFETAQMIDLSNCQVSEEIFLLKVWTSEVVLPKDFKGKLYMYPYNNDSELPIIKGNSVGTIELSGYKITEEVSLPSFTSISEEISIKNFPKLRKIDLKSIQGEVKNVAINSCNELEEINLSGISSSKIIKINGEKIQTIDMSSLKSVEQLDLQACKQLDNPIFTALTDITDKFSIGGSWMGYQNEALKTLNGFSALTKVGALEIKYSPLLTDYTGLKKLVESNGISEKKWTVHDNGYNPTFQDLKEGRYVQ